MKKRPIPTSLSGFTLVEVLVVSALTLLLIAGVYTLISCANVLTYKSFAINSTGTESHLALDQLQGALQTAYTVPTPIDSTGAVISGTLSIKGTAAIASGMAPVVSAGTSAEITGTGAGIKFKRYVGGPYIPVIPSGGLSGTATTITIELDNNALPPPPLPKANDILLINTTALQGAEGFQAWATVSGSPTLVSTSGSRVKYSVPLTSPMLDKEKDGTAITSIAYQTDNQGNAVSYSASLLRPTAFLFSARGNKTELGMIDSYSMSNGKVVLTGNNYVTLTREIDTNSSNPSRFAIVSIKNEISMESKTFVSVVLRIRSSDYDNYLANKQNDGFCTFMGFSALINLKSTPDSTIP